jgi:coproporphyrinogen III oxidase-like Fe-S oxidoreductase
MPQMSSLIEAGLNLDPAQHAFTYTFPPARIARRDANTPGLLSTELDTWEEYSLYLHLPFCRMACRFCSLHRVLATSDERVGQYCRGLLHEIALLQPNIQEKRCHSIYVGGGTPTLLDPSQLAEVVAAATAGVTGAGCPEITIECAPDEDRSANDWDNYFSKLASLTPGVTRVSIGVESTDPAALHHMGRRGGLRAVLDVASAADRCFDSYNVDFLIGYPDDAYSGQRDTTNILKGVDDLRAHGLRLPAISLYEMWDVGHVPATRKSTARRPEPHEIWETKQRIQDYLYSLSYSPSPGCTFVADPAYVHHWTLHRCFDFRHIGLGSGSYSFTPGGFSQRARDIPRYVNRAGSAKTFAQLDQAIGIGYSLTQEEQELRRVILGLRSADWVTKPNGASLPVVELAEKLQRMLDAGIIEEREGRIRLAKEAFLWSNEISAALHPQQTPRTWRA